MSGNIDAAVVKWWRSWDGYCESRCGRYFICPNYCGCTRPQDYELYFHPKRGKRKRLESMANTQRDCKETAEWHAKQQIKP